MMKAFMYEVRNPHTYIQGLVLLAVLYAEQSWWVFAAFILGGFFRGLECRMREPKPRDN